MMIEDFSMPRALRLKEDERGATAIEYGLIAALISVAAITTVSALGTQLNKTFNNVAQGMKKGTG
jgi:pilus assembly protein Flp/PilA